MHSQAGAWEREEDKTKHKQQEKNMHRLAAYGLISLLLVLLTSCSTQMVNKQQVIPTPIVKKRPTEPPTAPILRLENGMHTTAIKSINTDAQQRFVLTVSKDKTARLWSVKDGQLLRTFRPPQGAGHEGKLYAAALSPDGNTVAVAVAGWTGYEWDSKHSIYLFQRQSGQLIQRLQGLPNVIHHLSFSKEGRYLAASLGVKNGIRVFNTHTGALVFKDSDYGGDSYSVDFAADGKLLSSSYDGYLRLYSADFKLLAKQTAIGGQQPHFARFSPDGQRIAVGFDDSTQVNILSGTDLKHLYSADTTAVNNGGLSSVAWSHDGNTLYAAGRFWRNGKVPIAAWSKQGRGALRWLPAASNIVMDLLPLKQGDLLYATADPAWGRVSANAQPRFQQAGQVADFRHIYEGQFGLSAQGKQLQFGYQVRGKQPAQFDMNSRQLSLNPSVSAALKAPDTQSLAIKGWEDTTSPTLNGKALALSQYEMSRSLAISPDQQQFLLGTSWNLRLFDKNGTQRWQQAVPDVVWGVNIAANGKVAVAAFGDGTIRWYRLRDGVELLAFYPHPDKKRWVLWTPEGYYDASAGAENLIGWHVNQGKDQAADFFSMAKFRDQYYRPDVIEQVLNTYDVAKALTLANQLSGKRQQATASINSLLPPVLSILSPDTGSTFKQPKVTLSFRTRTPSGEAVTNIKVLLDGRVHSQQRGLKRIGQGKGQTDEITLTLPKRDVEITLIAENRFSASEPSSIHLKWTGQSEGFVIKPKLYVLSVGISDYDDKALKLNYAAKDARDFAALIKQQQNGLYREVVINSIIDGSKDNILDGLEWIEREVTAKDVAMVFMAGHGVNDRNGSYYFLPKDANTDKLKRTALPYSMIKDTITNLPSKVLYFLDSCHAGNVMGSRRGNADITRVVNDLTSAENGVVVFAASSGNQFSLENSRWGNGAFTKALLEGIAGKADYHQTGRITINMLDLYLSERVKVLTDGQQTPTTTKPKTIADFPVVMRMR